jgi:hypothetical protein
MWTTMKSLALSRAGFGIAAFDKTGETVYLEE